MNRAPQAEPLRLSLMLLLSLATGLIAGIAAWLFRLLIGLIHNLLFLGDISGSYDANSHTAASPWGPGLILVPVIGGLAVTWLVRNFAPEAKGHGVPEVMHAIFNNDGLIRPRVALVKSLASAIAIGSGASVGREGPIVQIGSAFGSMLGQFIRMPASQRNLLIAAGSGAGIAATFNAPLGGMVFAVELLLISVNPSSLFLVAIATVTATHIGRVLIGPQSSFDIPAIQLAEAQDNLAISLLLLFALGTLIGLLSTAFIRGLYWAEDRFDALPGNDYTRHACGMLCVGIMLYLMMSYTGNYYVQGVGYASIVDILTAALSDPAFLLLLCGLKYLATCISLGSGSSGGVFSPTLFMGATAGAAFGQLLLLAFPELGLSPIVFAIAGMAAAIAGTTGAVLTGIIMLLEMTSDYSIVVPLLVAASTAGAVRKLLLANTIYTLKLARRGEMVPEELRAVSRAHPPN